MPDYTRCDPKGWCGDPTRGAAMGRPTVQDAPKDYDGKLYLRYIRLDMGGYDCNGTYFGIGQRLYWCANEDHAVDFMLRASDREHARILVLDQYQKAKVRR
jgi:hypothetical protein